MYVRAHYVKYLRFLGMPVLVLAAFYFLLRTTPASEAVHLPTNEVTARQATEPLGALNRLSVGGLAELNHYYYLYHDLLIHQEREPASPAALVDGHELSGDKGQGL